VNTVMTFGFHKSVPFLGMMSDSLLGTILLMELSFSLSVFNLALKSKHIVEDLNRIC